MSTNDPHSQDAAHEVNKAWRAYEAQDLLREACAAGRPSRVAKALSDGADPNDVDHHGWTALQHLAQGACERPATQRAILDLLLDAGADLNRMALPTRDGQKLATPIVTAAQKEKWSLVETLAKQGATLARLERPDTPHDVSYTWKELSVLCLTVRSGPARTVRTLLDHGTSTEDTEYHQTALTLAVWSLGNTSNLQRVQRLTENIELLLQRGAAVTGPLNHAMEADYRPFRQIQNLFSRTPLGVAVEERCPVMVNRLIAAGAWSGDFRWRHRENQTDLAGRAIVRGNPGALARLFQEGLGQDWDAKTWNGLVDEARKATVQPTLQLTEKITPERIAQQHQVLVLLEEQVLRQTMHADEPPVLASPRSRL